MTNQLKIRSSSPEEDAEFFHSSIFPLRYQGEVAAIEFVGEYDQPFDVSIEGFVFQINPAIERVVRMPARLASILMAQNFRVHDEDGAATAPNDLSQPHFVRWTGLPTVPTSQRLEPDANHA